MLKIEVNVPALDRLCDILERGCLPQLLSVPTTKAVAPSEPEEKVEKPAKVEKPKAEKPAKVEKPKAEKPAAPEITVAELTELGKKLIEQTSPAVLRATLDSVGIEGKKISTCDSEFYPAIKEAIEKAIAEADL